MARSGVDSSPNWLSDTAMDHRIAAQYGQNSAPMYSISGLPALVSGGPLMALTRWAPVGTVPVPTASSALDGTVVTFLPTAAGRADPETPPEDPLPPLPEPEPLFSLTTTRTTTMTITARTAPPEIRSLRRVSAFRAAACCAAIRSRALCCLLRCALLIRWIIPSVTESAD